jgi:hypothetical protein
MALNNATGKAIFQEVANSTSSFTIVPPSNVSNLFIEFDSITATSTGVFLQAQVAPSSGVFVTTGYTSGALYAAYNGTVWTNQSSSSAGFNFGRQFTSGETQSGYVYITDLITSGVGSQARCFGSCIANAGGVSYTVAVTGQTNSAAQSYRTIRIQMSSSTIASGTIIIYPL